MEDSKQEVSNASCAKSTISGTLASSTACPHPLLYSLAIFDNNRFVSEWFILLTDRKMLDLCIVDYSDLMRRCFHERHIVLCFFHNASGYFFADYLLIRNVKRVRIKVSVWYGGWIRFPMRRCFHKRHIVRRVLLAYCADFFAVYTRVIKCYCTKLYVMAIKAARCWLQMSSFRV